MAIMTCTCVNVLATIAGAAGLNRQVTEREREAMALRAGKLWVVRPAPLTVPEPMPATMTAALLRAVAKTAERRAVLSMAVGAAS